MVMSQASENTMSKMPRQRSRWSQPTSSLEMTVKSMLDLRQLESFSVSHSASQDSLSQASNGDDHKESINVSNYAKKVRNPHLKLNPPKTGDSLVLPHLGGRGRWLGKGVLQ